MTQPGSPAQTYKVAYSGRVREKLAEVLRQQVTVGNGPAALNAIKALDYRLRVYPQFGEVLQDLQMEGESRWIAAVPPFVVEYIIDEVHRCVFVVVPLKIL
jgi:hypothetical protein